MKEEAGKKKEAHIGIYVRRLTRVIDRVASAAATSEFGDSATATHGWVIRYLYENRNRDVFQKDLEQRFSVRRSTMTSILQLMEKKGLITKEPVPHDARLKKLNLTPAAIKVQEGMRKQIDEIERKMRQGISEDELETFLKITEKMTANLSEG